MTWARQSRADARADAEFDPRVTDAVLKLLPDAVADAAREWEIPGAQKEYAQQAARGGAEQLAPLLRPLANAEHELNVRLANRVRADVIVVYLFGESVTMARDNKTTAAQVRERYLNKTMMESCRYLKESGETPKQSLWQVVARVMDLKVPDLQPKPNKYGYIDVSSIPPGCEVLIDTTYTGPTDGTFVAVTGEREVCVRCEGSPDCVTKVKVESGRTVKCKCEPARTGRSGR